MSADKEPTLQEAQVARKIKELSIRAWNRSRPHPQEVEFDQMTDAFRQRIEDYTHVLIIMMARERML